MCFVLRYDVKSWRPMGRACINSRRSGLSLHNSCSLCSDYRQWPANVSLLPIDMAAMMRSTQLSAKVTVNCSWRYKGPNRNVMGTSAV